DPSSIDPHARIRRKPVENLLPVLLAQTVEVELVVVAEEVGVLRRFRAGRECVQSIPNGISVLAREGEEKVVVEDEVQEQVHPLSITEKEGKLVGTDVGFRQKDGLLSSGGEEVPELSEKELGVRWIGALHPFAFEEERSGIEIGRAHV